MKKGGRRHRFRSRCDDPPFCEGRSSRSAPAARRDNAERKKEMHPAGILIIRDTGDNKNSFFFFLLEFQLPFLVSRLAI